MPNDSLPVPHFEQSRDGSCLPACVRMVLSYLGDERTEAEVSQLLGTKAYGTPIRNAARLREDGRDVQVRQITRTGLESILEAGTPVFVRAWTIMLGYWDVTTSHVVVVVGYDESFVFINDPAFPNAPQQVVWDAF